MYKEKFAENLKALIGDRSVRSIAKEMNMHNQTLLKYIHAQREIGLETLVKIADFFGEDLDILVGRKDY